MKKKNFLVMSAIIVLSGCAKKVVIDTELITTEEKANVGSVTTKLDRIEIVP